MARAHSNITVGGDDAQSIYSFRGATIRNILEFPTQFPGTRVVTLDRNYRSTPQILGTSNTLIAHAGERFAKTLWTERAAAERPLLVTARDEPQQTRYVVDRILELHEEGIALRNIAVLFRAGYMSADLDIELANRKIPFEKWGGIKFLEAAHVKDVLAFLRLLENPRDEVSWYRLLLLLPADQKVASVDVAPMDDASPPPLILDAANARVELTPITLAGKARGPTVTATFPFSLHGPAEVALYFDRGGRGLSVGKTFFVVRDAAGAELALVRVRR